MVVPHLHRGARAHVLGIMIGVPSVVHAHPCAGTEGNPCATKGKQRQAAKKKKTSPTRPRRNQLLPVETRIREKQTNCKRGKSQSSSPLPHTACNGTHIEREGEEEEREEEEREEREGEKERRGRRVRRREERKRRGKERKRESERKERRGERRKKERRERREEREKRTERKRGR